MGNRAANLAWIDLEMTGLDPDRCYILEIATLVTTEELELVAEGPTLVVHASDAELETLSKGAARPSAPGLLERVRASRSPAHRPRSRRWPSPRSTPTRAPRPCAATRSTPTASSLVAHAPAPRSPTTATSTCPPGRRCPALVPDALRPPKKAGTHVALADVHESVAELAYYREAFSRRARTARAYARHPTARCCAARATALTDAGGAAACVRHSTRWHGGLLEMS
jgi:oligoribonuclease